MERREFLFLRTRHLICFSTETKDFYPPFRNNLRTVKSIVVKLAVPPIKLEIGSARKTPLTPMPAKWGRIRVSGTTMMIFRKREKKMECFDIPSPTKVDCPTN